MFERLKDEYAQSVARRQRPKVKRLRAITEMARSIQAGVVGIAAVAMTYQSHKLTTAWIVGIPIGLIVLVYFFWSDLKNLRAANAQLKPDQTAD